MSKDYFCKDCDNNNNGWCKKHKFNGIKKIIECDDKAVNGIMLIHQKDDEDSKISELHERYKNVGAREIFNNIQMQLCAMKNSDTVFTVKQIMVNLEKILVLNENIHGIQPEFIIDQDIINNSKNISAIWLKEVGEFKNTPTKPIAPRPVIIKDSLFKKNK